MVLTDAEVKIKYGIDQLKSVGLPDPSNAAGTTREIFNETMQWRFLTQNQVSQKKFPKKGSIFFFIIS